MNCPFCKNTMRRGAMHSTNHEGIYWIPEHLRSFDVGRLYVTKKADAAHGDAGKPTPESYYCDICKIWITKDGGEAAGE